MARPAESIAKKKRNKTKRRVKDAQEVAKGRRRQAATLLQAVYRGLCGRRIAAYRRVYEKAATSIQRCFRGVLRRRTMIEERDKRRREESGSVDPALDLASPSAREDEAPKDQPNSEPEDGKHEGTLSSPASTNSGGWWGGYETSLGSDEGSDSSIGGGSTGGYASSSRAGEREVEGGPPSPWTDDGEAWGGYFPPDGSTESNTCDDDIEGTTDEDGAQGARGEVSAQLPRRAFATAEVVELPAEQEMDTQVDDVDQAKPRTPRRPSAPVFTPRTPLRACAPAFTPRTPLRACAPAFTPAAATKEGEKGFRPKVALRGSATDFAHAATGVGPRQPPKAELPAMVVDGGVPPLHVSTPSPMPTPVPPPPGVGSPRPPPPQHVDDFSIAPATKPSAAAVASGQTAALAAPPSGMGHYTGLRGDGNNLSSPHSDSDQEPCPRRYASRTSFGRIPPRCHVNVIDIMSTSMENLCMVMPAAFCDVQHLPRGGHRMPARVDYADPPPIPNPPPTKHANKRRNRDQTRKQAAEPVPFRRDAVYPHLQFFYIIV